MADQDRRATFARLAPLVEVLAPMALTAVAYGGVVRVAFHLDDHLHLYDIVNLGAKSILINFAGHMYLTRNTVLLLLHALFGMNAPATMTVVLLNHLLAVGLMVVVIRALTGNGAVASVIAAWWGTSPMNMETVAWYSVYGQVLVITALLYVLLVMARVVRGEPLGTTAAVTTVLALLAAATSFGTGLAMVLAMPVALWVMLPASSGRAPLLRAAAIAAGMSLVLYVVTDQLNRLLFGASSVVMPRASGQWLNSVIGLGHLLLSGLTVAATGPWYLGLQSLGGWTTPLVSVLAGALLATAWRRWRLIVGCLLLSAAPYTLIAIARYGLPESGTVDALSSRYHYVAPLGAYLALAIALAALLDRVRHRVRAAVIFAGVGYAAAVAAYVCCFPPIPTHRAVQFQVDKLLAQTIATIRAHPPGDVYIRQRPFFTSDLTSVKIGDTVIPVPPRRFPGTPALFALYHDSNVFEGRRVYFTVTDPARVEAWKRGRRGADLIISWQEMLERTGQAPAQGGGYSPTSGGAAPSTPR